MPEIANIEFDVGEDWKILGTMHDSVGNVIDIATVTAVKWRLALNCTLVTELTLGDGITMVGDGSAGQCLIGVTPAQQLTLGIKPTFYDHECQVILGDGTVTDQFAGYLRAKPSLFPV